MPTRRTPQPEEARKLFIKYPNKTLQEWADEWGSTAERVRQIRHEAGVGAVFKLDMETVNWVAKQIEKGTYTLADRDMYKNLNIGFEAFKTWIRENNEVQIIIEKAQEAARKQKYNPVNKICTSCKESKEVSKYKRNQKFADGYGRICNDCQDKVVSKKIIKTKVCKSCKKEKSKKSFTANRKFKDGLVPFCKNCKSRMRRAKRTLNTKVADII